MGRLFRGLLFTILWVLTVLLVLFCVISFASVVVRPYALVSLCIAILLTVFRKRSNSWTWVVTCVLGIAVSLGSLYPLATAHGTSATSYATSDTSNPEADYASTHNFLAQDIASTYGVGNPIVKTGDVSNITIPQNTVYIIAVDPRYDDPVSKATSVYNVTLMGNFKKGHLIANKLIYKITPDSKKISDAVGYGKFGDIVWQDSVVVLH